jgi:hypothetical protein
VALLRLSPQERARCNQKVGMAAAKAPQVFGIDPLKRKRFDEQADADERRRQDRTGPLQGAVKACSEVDDRAMATNLGGGCLSSHTTIRPN